MSDNLFRAALDELGAVLAKIDERPIDAACRMIAGARTIGVYGCGREALQIKGFAMRLFHLGLPVAVVGDMTMSALGRGDVFLVTSGPGETSTVLALMQSAKTAGATNLLLTAEPESSAASLPTSRCVSRRRPWPAIRAKGNLRPADGFGLRRRAVRAVRGDGAKARDTDRRHARGDTRQAHQHGVSEPYMKPWPALIRPALAMTSTKWRLRSWQTQRPAACGWRQGAGGAGSALVVEYLTQCVLDRDQVLLVRHHLVDRLVGLRVLVHQGGGAVRVPGAAAHRLSQGRGRQLPLRPGARHPAAGSVGAGVVRHRVTEPAHDVRARAHRARDHALVAGVGLDGSPTGDPQVLTVVPLLSAETVIAVAGENIVLQGERRSAVYDRAKGFFEAVNCLDGRNRPASPLYSGPTRLEPLPMRRDEKEQRAQIAAHDAHHVDRRWRFAET